MSSTDSPVRTRLRDLIRPAISAHLTGVVVDIEQVVTAAALLARCYARGGKVLTFGNGGSAACAQHLAGELVGRMLVDRGPLGALSLTSDSAVITAIANDFGFEQVFARQVAALGRPGDVAVAFSTSGRSANVLAGVETARRIGLGTIGLVGGTEAPLGGLVDVAVHAQSDHPARIQETHLAVQHALCAGVEAALGAPALGDDGEPPPRGTVVDLERLVALRRNWREVVFVHGLFDVLRPSDIDALMGAARLGDVLVVGVDGDAAARRRLRGAAPSTPALSRATAVAALRAVDYAVIIDDPADAVACLQPTVVRAGLP